MNRPRAIWFGFGLCIIFLLGATGWVSWTALSLEKAQQQMRRSEAVEEKVRLALWRMDSLLAPLVAQESGRPYFTYNSFYSAELAYRGVAADRAEKNATAPMLPSPLLSVSSSNVLLHFQYGPDGRLTSPQLPEGAQRKLASPQFISREQLTNSEAKLRQFEALMQRAASASKPAQRNRDMLFTSLPTPDGPVPVLPPVPQQQVALQQSPVQAAQAQQFIANQREINTRSQSVQQAISFNAQNGGLVAEPPSNLFAQGPLKGVWIDGALVLARRVGLHGRDYVQGCWVNWPSLNLSLRDSIRDLCPKASLEPFSAGTEDPQGRILVSLPIRLVPGPVNDDALAPSSFPLRLVLGLVWACMIVAMVAVGVLLHGVVSLSERRAMFVSAVSHELRTPLTTFKMYSEMLAEDMVPDPSARKEYLRTLCSEANRLGHLVENVLAYARLERGSARANVERLKVCELFSRIEPRLQDRAQQAGLRLVTQSQPEASGTELRIDVTAVEQILFNLVDNACKYAVTAVTERTLEVEIALAQPCFVIFRVKDHGPGLSDEARRKLFQPFGKSAQEAAKGAPGVGLGLALCRRLSRSLGGDLRLVQADGDGTVFELKLPTSNDGQ